MFLLALFVVYCVEHADASAAAAAVPAAAAVKKAVPNNNKRKNKGGKKQQNAGNAAAVSSSAHFQKLFLECAVKQRMGEGAVFQTLFAHTAIGTQSALFFDLAGNVFIAQHALLNLCKDDEDAKRPPAKLITHCQQNGSDKHTAEIDIAGAKIELTSNGGGGGGGKKAGCVGKTAAGGGEEEETKIEFETYTIDSYGCPGGPPCGGLRVALVERINHAGLADVKNAYYSGDAKIAQCVQQVCGAGKKLEEVYDKGTKGVAADGKKLKQHKVFRECAVKRRDGSIETLVKNIPLSGTQTLFFSKGEHMYIGRRSGSVKGVCEKDKSAKLQIPVSQAVVSLRNNKMWFNHSETTTAAGKSGGGGTKLANGYQRGGHTQTEVFNVAPSGGGPTAANKYCRAFTKNGAYMVFLCQRDVCGVDRLILLRKKKEEATDKAVKGKKGKTRQPQVNNLMSMENGREEVHVDHIFLVDHFGKADAVLNSVRQRCKGALGIVDGVKEEGAAANAVAEDDATDGDNDADEAEKKCNPSRKGRCRALHVKQAKSDKAPTKGGNIAQHMGGTPPGNTKANNNNNNKNKKKLQNAVARQQQQQKKNGAANGRGKKAADVLDHDGTSMKNLFAEKAEDTNHEEEKKQEKEAMTKTPAPAGPSAMGNNAAGAAKPSIQPVAPVAAAASAKAGSGNPAVASNNAQQQQKMKAMRDSNKSSPI